MTLPSRRTGYAHAISAYVIWGLLPIYWRALKDVPSIEVVLHRIVWAVPVLLVFLWTRRRLLHFLRSLGNPREALFFFLSSCLLATNWSGFIYAIQQGYFLQCSLAYFLSPILTVLVGVFILRERLSPLKWIAVAIVASGVVALAILGRGMPGMALFLAGSWSIYSFTRRKSPRESLEGLTYETLLLALPGAAILLWLESTNRAVFLQSGALGVELLLIGAGAATSVPLLFFSSAARKLELSTLGMLQYIGPIVQFLLAVFVFHEPFDRGDRVAYPLIWIGLGLFVYAISRERRNRGAPVPA